MVIDRVEDIKKAVDLGFIVSMINIEKENDYIIAISQDVEFSANFIKYLIEKQLDL